MRTEIISVSLEWLPKTEMLHNDEYDPQHSQLEGTVVLGVIPVAEEEEEVEALNVSLTTFVADESQLLDPYGSFHFTDIFTTRKSLVGECKVVATEKELFELMLALLQGHDMLQPTKTNFVMVVEELVDRNQEATLLIKAKRDPDEDLNVACWFVECHFSSYSEYGYSICSGKTTTTPETHMVETHGQVLQHFYPDVDMV